MPFFFQSVVKAISAIEEPIIGNVMTSGELESNLDFCDIFVEDEVKRDDFGILEKLQNVLTKVKASNSSKKVITAIFVRTLFGLSSLYITHFITYIIFRLTLLAPTPQNGQTHSNNLSAFANELFERVSSFCGFCEKLINQNFRILEH